VIFHELATNAAKYGALSTADGGVGISWEPIADEASGQQLIQLIWIEHDGPPIDGFGPAGFGTGFIRRSVDYELLGRANIELPPQGLRFCMTFPTAGNVEEAAAERY
jgi:two-component system CheB/CheR fusion protein